MKKLVVLIGCVVFMNTFFGSMAIAAPSMPSDLQMAQPDSSLPKELSAFFGKWEGTGRIAYFLIVEQIDKEKASLYAWELVAERPVPAWEKYEAQVMKEAGKYKLWYRSGYGNCDLTLKGDVLIWSRMGYGGNSELVRLSRAP